MFVRRLAEDLRRQNWTTVAIELVVLTLGVFLGLQAENWNQNRKDRAELRGYTERLINDFAAIRDRCRQLISEIDRELEAHSQISALTHGNGMDPNVDYAALIREIGGYGVPPARAASYLDILESSKLGLFQDSSIADALIRCDNSMQRNLSASEIRMQYGMEHSEQLMGLSIDVKELSFEDAIQFVDTEARSFQQELRFHRAARRGDKTGYEAIIDCSTQVIEKLTASN